MLAYIAGRLVASVPVLVGVSLAVFAMLFLVPGDPVRMMLAEFVTTPDQVARMRAQLHLGWLPATGGGDLRHLVLPAVTLGTVASALIARLTRSSLLEVLGQDYVRTARAKGLAGWPVVVRHALRNALIPVVTIFGLQFGNLLAGAVIVETVFSRPGLGRLIVGGILSKDFPLVQGTVLFVATVYVLINVLVDVAYAYADPRIRFGER